MDEKLHYLVSDTKQNGQKNPNFVIIDVKDIILDRSMFLFIKHNFDDKVKNKGFKVIKNDNSLPLNKWESVKNDIENHKALDPIKIKQFKTTKYYEIIDGRHRYVSSIYNDFTHIPCIIYEEL